MLQNNTEQLIRELMENESIDACIRENMSCFSEESVPVLITAAYKKHRIKKVELARRSHMSVPYLHQLFSGTRKPSRNMMICLAVALGMPLGETQELLREAGFAELWPNHKRDAVIYHGIVHATPLDEINANLLRLEEDTLF